MSDRIPTAAKSLLAERENNLPVWIRAPKTGTEHYTGLTKPMLYGLKTKGAIVSKCIKEPGKVKGVRLFHLGSILDYIDSIPEENK